MPKGVTGPEWGPLAGLPYEEALRLTIQYAAELEKKVEGRGNSRVSDDDSDDEDVEFDARELAKGFHSQTVAPAANEFVGKRESAKATARQYIRQQGYDWNVYSDYVEQAMAKTTADQQIDPNAWVEAWWYVWGLDKRQQELAAKQNPKSDEEETTSPPRSETRVEQGSMNSDRPSQRNSRPTQPKWDIPEDERKTKAAFERVLGIRMPDEEWYRLQNEEINTYDDYMALQDQIAAGRKR